MTRKSWRLSRRIPPSLLSALSALPRRCALFWRPRVLLLVATAIGAGLTTWWLPWETLPALNWTTLRSLNFHLLAQWLTVLSVIGALVWAAVSAVQEED